MNTVINEVNYAELQAHWLYKDITLQFFLSFFSALSTINKCHLPSLYWRKQESYLRISSMLSLPLHIWYMLTVKMGKPQTHLYDRYFYDIFCKEILCASPQKLCDNDTDEESSISKLTPVGAQSPITLTWPADLSIAWTLMHLLHKPLCLPPPPCEGMSNSTAKKSSNLDPCWNDDP